MGEKPYKRRERQRNARRRGHALRGSARGSEALDSLEFVSVFLTTGGMQHVGMPTVAYDCNQRPVGKAIVPHILEIGRDKATEFMRMAEEALAVQARKDSLRVDRGKRQANAILDARDSGQLRWLRLDSDDGDMATMRMPDGCETPVCQHQKSYLVGSSDLDDKSPLNEATNQVVCFRTDNGQYYVGEETYGEDSERIFVPLNAEGRPITYPTRDVAERSTLANVELGEVDRLSDRLVGDIHASMSRRMRVWKRGEAADAAFEEFTREVHVSDKYQRVTTPKIAACVRPRADDLQVADVGAKQSLRIRVKPLVDIQLTQNRVDSE